MRVDVADGSFLVEDGEFTPFWRRVAAGDWEPASFEVLRQLLTPASTFIDVGAWIGPLTLYAAGLARRCHALEPDPRARGLLLANIALNPALAERIEVHATAVGDRAGPAALGNITSSRGGDSMSSLLFGDAATSWTVDCNTLGEFATTVAPDGPDLVKIDIEGAEVEVLAASREYLEEVRPPLYLSVHGRFWPDPEPRMRTLLDVLSSYDELLTPELLPLRPEDLLDADHLGGLFEVVVR